MNIYFVKRDWGFSILNNKDEEIRISFHSWHGFKIENGFWHLGFVSIVHFDPPDIIEINESSQKMDLIEVVLNELDLKGPAGKNAGRLFHDGTNFKTPAEIEEHLKRGGKLK